MTAPIKSTTKPYVSEYLRNTMLNHVLRSASVVAGSSVWLGLYNQTITYHEGDNDNWTKVVETELSGSSYRRVSASNVWTISNRQASLNTTLEFPIPTGESWGRVSHYGISNGSQSGSLLFFGELSASRTIDEGDTFLINPSQINITLNGHISTFLANELLDHYLNRNIYTSPSALLHAALYITLPNQNDAGGVEISGSTGYARIPCGGTGSWAASAGGSSINLRDIIYAYEVITDWSTIRGICLRDAIAAGNLLMRADVYPNVTVLYPDGFMIPAALWKMNPIHDAEGVL